MANLKCKFELFHEHLIASGQQRFDLGLISSRSRQALRS